MTKPWHRFLRRRGPEVGHMQKDNPGSALKVDQMQRDNPESASESCDTLERSAIRDPGPSSGTSSDRSAVDMYTTIFAVTQSLTTCSIHEHCDGSCTGHQISYAPMVSATCDFRAVQTPSPRVLEPGVFCRDAKWLANQTLEPFTHVPVNSRASYIRLLRVKDANFLEDVVECDLIDVCLNDKPIYAAISYVWGAPCFDRAIFCNEKRTWITASLESALKQYRRDRDTEKPRLLWADALCINQGNEVELTAQLTLMRRIYSEAAIVYVHLGDVDVSWYYGLELLKKLCFISELEQNKPNTPSRKQAQACEHYGLPEPEHKAWSAYLKVLSSPWFTRTWIIQEITLAAKTKVRFGPFAFEWDELLKSIQIARSLEVGPGNFNTVPGFLYLTRLNQVRAMHKRRKTFVTLLYTLIITRDFEVSDPRDKINAILPLADQRWIDGLVHFPADYTVSAETLYHRFAIYLVDTQCAQPMLNLAGLQRRNLDLTNIPTWVPDWTAQTRDIGSRHMAMIRHESYSATRKYPPSIKFAGSETQDEPEVLVARGCCLDTIAALIDALNVDDTGGAGRLQIGQNVAHEFLTWHNAAEALIKRPDVREKIATTYEDALNAFIRTLLVDDLYTGENVVDGTTPITDLEAAYDSALASFAKVVDGADHLSYLKERKMDQPATFQMQTLAACSGHRFAVTQNGYIGLVPHCARVGDQIALILGAPIPFILRDSGKSEGGPERRLLQLVGDAYIHGMMYGEAMDLEGFALHEIWLC